MHAGEQMGEGGLGDVRVIEMGQLLAGPFCGQLLGDFGAEVIKVEPPGSGDPMREWGREKPHGQSLWWPILARNKKSVTLNLRVERGQELARELIATADVLVENFRPGTLERWGLAPDDLWRDNPGLIITRVTGYGQSGPYAARAGFGSIGEAMGGIRYVTGDPDKPPSRAGISLGDELAGTFAALGTLVALHARQRTGRGQIVDAALYEAVLALMESLLPEWEIAGYQRERTGSVLPNVAPSNAYPTADGPVLIAANQDSVFRRLAAVMGQPELADDVRYATHGARGANAGDASGVRRDADAERGPAAVSYARLGTDARTGARAAQRGDLRRAPEAHQRPDRSARRGRRHLTPWPSDDAVSWRACRRGRRADRTPPGSRSARRGSSTSSRRSVRRVRARASCRPRTSPAGC
jgi:formyl-CoA transferase